MISRKNLPVFLTKNWRFLFHKCRHPPIITALKKKKKIHLSFLSSRNFVLLYINMCPFLHHYYIIIICIFIFISFFRFNKYRWMYILYLKKILSDSQCDWFICTMMHACRHCQRHTAIISEGIIGFVEMKRSGRKNSTYIYSP